MVINIRFCILLLVQQCVYWLLAWQQGECVDCCRGSNIWPDAA